VLLGVKYFIALTHKIIATARAKDIEHPETVLIETLLFYELENKYPRE